MSAIAGSADVYTDFNGLARLRGKARDDQSEETLREVAGQFEALFIQMMLKSMRDASLGEGLLDSQQSKTYQSMFDQQIALDMSKHQGLGLAEVLVRQLRKGSSSEQVDPAAAPVSPQMQALALSAPAQQQPRADVEMSRAEPVSAAAPRPADWRPDSPQVFVRDLWPHAQKAARELGTSPEFLIAQAALETGWGQHMIRGRDGRNSFNLFGIKADAGWQGRRVTTETLEFRDGLMRRERAPFRAYVSPEESFSDYADFLRSNPRYAEALQRAGDSTGFGQALADAGYATDPQYPQKINRILNGERMQDTLAEIRGELDTSLF